MTQEITRWTLDPSRSAVNFSVKHLMLSKVHGSFKKFSGVLSYHPERPAESSVEAVVEISSIDTRDEKRDEYLRTSDFFEITRFPTMSYRANGIRLAGKGEFEIQGELTLHGVTRKVIISGKGLDSPVKDASGAVRLKASGNARIRRKDFGLEWTAAIEAGGVLVGDEVSIHLETEWIKNG
jgi:polyisoprenoid-binding protein YceI